MFDSDDPYGRKKFVDSEGNIISTAFKEREKQLLQQQLMEREKKEQQQAVVAAKKRIAVDNAQARAQREALAHQAKREKMSQLAKLPAWISAMPYIPLTDPPSRGAWNKAHYALTRKVSLTDEEKQLREQYAANIKQAIADVTAIRRPRKHAPTIIGVLSTSLAPAPLSAALAHTIRACEDASTPVFVFDLGFGTVSNSTWLGSTTTSAVFLSHLVRLKNTYERFGDVVCDVFPVAPTREYVVSNSFSPEQRYTPSPQDLEDIIGFLPDNSVCVISGSVTRQEDVATVSALSHTVVVDAIIDKETATRLSSLSVTQPRVIVLCIPHATLHATTPAIQAFISTTTAAVGKQSPYIVVGYDPALHAAPVKWEKLHEETNQALRRIVRLALHPLSKEA